MKVDVVLLVLVAVAALAIFNVTWDTGEKRFRRPKITHLLVAAIVVGVLTSFYILANPLSDEDLFQKGYNAGYDDCMNGADIDEDYALEDGPYDEFRPVRAPQYNKPLREGYESGYYSCEEARDTGAGG